MLRMIKTHCAKSHHFDINVACFNKIILIMLTPSERRIMDRDCIMLLVLLKGYDRVNFLSSGVKTDDEFSLDFSGCFFSTASKPFFLMSLSKSDKEDIEFCLQKTKLYNFE